MTFKNHAAKLCVATLAFAMLSFAPSADAQRPELTPGGPWVMPGPLGDLSVPAGRFINWQVAGTNFQPAPLTATLVTEPQNAECDTGGFNNEFGVFGGTNESAPQQYLSFVDNNADGDCNDPGESVIDDMGAPTLCEIMAPSGQQRLEIQNFTVPAFGMFSVEWRTDVDAMAAPPEELCSWAHFVNPMDYTLIQSTVPPGAGPMGVPMCTCLDVGIDSGLDGTVTKTATPDTLPLVPGDPNATIVYEITVTNTGGMDIMGATLTDSFMPDNLLEWTEVLTCDPPLMCSDIMMDPTTLTVTGWDLNPLEMDGTCAPGNTCTQTVIARALVTCAAATDDDSGEVCNQGEFNIMTVTFPTDDPDTPAEGDPTCTPVVFSNLTESTKRVVTFDDANMNGQLDAGETVTFEIDARNEGRLTASNLIVTDDLGAAGCWRTGTVDASASGGVVTGDSIQWDLGDLGPGANQMLAFDVVLDTDTLCCNQAFLQSDERDACGLTATIPTDDPTTMALDDPTCASPGPQPDLQIEKTWCIDPEPMAGCPGEAMAGNQIKWTITITNNGVGVATNAQLNDDFNLNPCNQSFAGEPGVTAMTTDGMDWGDASTSRPDSGGFPRDFGELIITNLGGANGIQPGETITVEFVVSNAITVTGCCNQAFVTFAEASEPQPSDDPASIGRPGDPTCLNAAAVTEGELEKVANTLDNAGGAPDGFISIGDQVEYQFLFQNVGSEIMSNVNITDLPPSCVTLDSASVVVVQDDTGTFMDSSAGGNLDVTIGMINPAEVVMFTITGDVAEIITGCCNQAAWTSDQVADGGSGLSDRDLGDFAPEQETCFDSVDIPTPMLQWTKVSDAAAGCNAPGTVVNYTLTVTNNGSGAVDTWDIVDDAAPFGGCANVMAMAPLVCDGGTDTLIVDSTTEGPVAAMGGTLAYRYSVTLPCDAAGGDEDPSGDFNYDDGSGGTVTLSDTAGSVQWGWPDLTTSGKVFNWDAGDMNGDGRINPGTPENAFSYTINVNNSGSCDATGVMLTDTYPASFVIMDAGGGVDDGTTITWDLGTVAAGGGTMVTFTAMIDEGNPPAPSNIPNQFSVSADNDGSGCAGMLPDPGLTDQIESTGGVPWDVIPNAAILRNPLVSCLAEATTVYDEIFSRARDRTDVTDPQIDSTVASTNMVAAPGSPVVIAGDADTAATNAVCPQEDPATGTLDNRVIVFYEYTVDGSVITVNKNGTDIEISW